MKTKFLFIRYWKSLLVTTCILYLSFAKPSTFSEIPSFKYEDKLVHLLMYVGLTLTLIFDYKSVLKIKNTSFFSFVLICIIFPVLLGGLIEILQPLYFAPRTAEWTDLFSNLLGVLLCNGLCHFFKITPTFSVTPTEKM